MSLNMSQIENDFQYALERQEFALHYQPKVNLTSGAIAGVEALIRWNHPQRGLLASGKFIPIAEACGAILPIGRWVLREACEQARAWQSAGLPRLRVGINVSTAELRAKDFVEGVRNILAETGMDPRFLELELTEAFLLENPQATGPVLRALKDTGAQLALDDFGTGYSSLSYLLSFPLDRIKIDRSFTMGLGLQERASVLVEGVSAMSRRLGMTVLIEGVETAKQLRMIETLGTIAEAQGYLFSRPVPEAEVCGLLRRDFRVQAA
jgi:EAL domain-containing protein (putative c-di-GMP-specific phosphodiesterase class I)